MTYFVVAFGLVGLVAVTVWRLSELAEDFWQRIVWG